MELHNQAAAHGKIVAAIVRSVLSGERLTTVGQFTVSAGQTIPFVLMHAQSHLPTPDPVDAQDALRRTQEFWERWASTHQSTGMYADAVSRSLITLKALTYALTGGIVAAPTTSCPSRLVVLATGTTGSAGCVTRR
jgi:GH15 family glucan-1,4-alpha-glucosidase